MPAKFYAVRVGRSTGVFDNWEEARERTYGYKGAQHKAFASYDEALRYIQSGPTFTAPQSGPNFDASFGGKAAARDTAVMHPSGSGPWMPQHVYVDGSSINNGRVGASAGIGIVWGDLKTYSERLPGQRQTNNRAEIFAVIRALELDPLPNNPMYIHTDSQLVISTFTDWWRTWNANGWRTADRKPVENKDMISYVLALIDRKEELCKDDFGFIKVAGHSGDPYNDTADGAARKGASMAPLRERDFEADLAKLTGSSSPIIHTTGLAMLRR